MNRRWEKEMDEWTIYHRGWGNILYEPWSNFGESLIFDTYEEAEQKLINISTNIKVTRTHLVVRELEER